MQSSLFSCNNKRKEDFYYSPMTLSITALSIMTFSITTVSIMTFNITILSNMTLLH
jgi:hypothetical protein